jgi:hypothetical protein
VFMSEDCWKWSMGCVCVLWSLGRRELGSEPGGGGWLVDGLGGLQIDIGFSLHFASPWAFLTHAPHRTAKNRAFRIVPRSYCCRLSLSSSSCLDWAGVGLDLVSLCSLGFRFVLLFYLLKDGCLG